MNTPRETPVNVEFEAVRAASPPAVCPVDRLPSRRRNKICLRVIFIGALNFVAYTIMYAVLGGDAHNGERVLRDQPDGTTKAVYLVRGHFIRSIEGRTREVSRGVWIYSYVHSISVFITSAAMIISMLVLARPHILATMRHGWISGPTFIGGFGAIVVLIAATAVIVFTWDMLSQLAQR